MRSYLSLIPISAKVHRRQNRMTLLCIIFAVFMVTAIFSMAEMGARMEQSRLSEKHGDFSLIDSLMDTAMGQTLMITHSQSIAQTADRILRVSDGVVTDFGRCRE